LIRARFYNDVHVIRVILEGVFTDQKKTRAVASRAVSVSAEAAAQYREQFAQFKRNRQKS
jgi:hypothetical protein